MAHSLELPATVAAYISDAAVRTATDALLKIKPSALPLGLEWEELNSYYRARGGAELTRHYMAHLLLQLWQRVWGERIGREWSVAPLDELVGDYAVTPEQIWDEKSFTTFHEQGQYILYTDVTLVSGKVSIAFSIEDSKGPLVRNDFKPFVWHEEGNSEWNGWQVLSLPLDNSGSLPLEELTGFAERAYRHAASMVR